MTHFIKQYGLILILLSLFVVAFASGQQLPLIVQQSFYTLSYVLKEVLLQLLPFLVFPYIATSLLSLKGRGGFFVLCIVASVALSNFTAISLAYGGSDLLPSLHLNTLPVCASEHNLNGLFTLNWIEPIQIEYALLLGFIMGIFLNRLPKKWLEEKLFLYRDFATFFFSRIFTPLLPLYIFGFLIKMVVENDCMALLNNFKDIILMIVAIQAVYLFILFFMGSAGNIRHLILSVKNTLPAWMVGFSTISSMVTLPVTLEATEKNVKDKNIGRLCITSTVNCHAAIDCIAIPLLALAIIYMTHGALPDFSAYLVFAFWLMLAQFSAVSVAGGSVFIAIPVLISQLGFTPEMIGLITGIAILIEPWTTAGNIMANSAFAMIVDRIYASCGKSKLLSKI